MANSRGCPHYRFRCEILAIQTREHITYRETEETVRTRFREDGKTYSFVTGRTNTIQTADEDDNTETDGCHGNKYQQSLNFRANIFIRNNGDCDTNIVNEDDTATGEIFAIDIGGGRGTGRGQGSGRDGSRGGGGGPGNSIFQRTSMDGRRQMVSDHLTTKVHKLTKFPT